MQLISIHSRHNSRIALLVEDGNTTQLTTVPFRLVFVEIGVDGLEEWSDKGCLPSWAYDTMLLPFVAHCIDDQLVCLA